MNTFITAATQVEIHQERLNREAFTDRERAILCLTRDALRNFERTDVTLNIDPGNARAGES